MTRFQPHPDTEDSGLFRQSAGRSQMSVSIAGAADGGALPLTLFWGCAKHDALVRSADQCATPVLTVRPVLAGQCGGN